jgi:hypothetical protein
MEEHEKNRTGNPLQKISLDKPKIDLDNIN